MVQISGRYLTVAGKNSARYVDKVWSTEKANDVTTVKFTRVPFNSLCSIFGRLKCRFPHVENLAFDECEFNLIGQLNALADVQGFTSIYISSEKNAIAGKEWRSYAIFRLHHWGLQTINDIAVSCEQKVRVIIVMRNV